jgi:ATP-dependent Clp protease ATP-binding subunit ClpX
MIELKQRQFLGQSVKPFGLRPLAIRFGLQSGQTPQKLTPRSLETAIKEDIVAQDTAVRQIVTLLYHHWVRFLDDQKRQQNKAAEKAAAAGKDKPTIQTKTIKSVVKAFFSVDTHNPMYSSWAETIVQSLEGLNAGTVKNYTSSLRAKISAGRKRKILLEPTEKAFAVQKGGWKQKSITEVADLMLQDLLTRLSNQPSVEDLSEAEAPEEEKVGTPLPKAVVPSDLQETVIDKHNAVVLGNTGVGKTRTLESAAEKLRERFNMDVPFVIVDATSYTEAGWVGNDIEDIAVRLIKSANGDIEKAQWGMVFVDEIDKKAASAVADGKDISGKGFQQSLIPFSQGTIATVTLGKEEEKVLFDTRNVLFIMGGAFKDMVTTIRERKDDDAFGIGFGKDPKPKEEGNAHHDDSDIYASVTPDNLVKEGGIMPELVGRFPIIIPLRDLDEDALMRVLTEPKSAFVKQYKKLFALNGVTVEFTEGALKAIAQHALSRGLGARSLLESMEAVTGDLQYNAPDMDPGTTVTIDQQWVEKELKRKGKAASKSNAVGQ